MKYNQYIDQTLLKPQATSKEIIKFVEEAKKYEFKMVCVNSSWIKFVKERLKGTKVGVCSAIGFPLGAMMTQVKVKEAKLSIDHGADEVDMVINIGRFKEGDKEFVLNEIKQVKKAIGDHILKVIIETALLSDKEIVEATKLVMMSGAEFIKTSTGFSFRGASQNDIKLMAETAQGKLQIKASGGVKSLADLKAMMELGANRIGTSSGAKLMDEAK